MENSIDQGDSKNIPPITLVENIVMTLNLLNLQQKMENSSNIPELFKITQVLANEFPNIDDNYPLETKIDIGVAFSAARTMSNVNPIQMAANYFQEGGITPNRIIPPDRYLDTILGSIELSHLIINIGVASALVMQKVYETVESNGYSNIKFYSHPNKYTLHFFVYKISC